MNMRKWPAKVTAVIALLVALGLVVISSGALSLITGPEVSFGFRNRVSRTRLAAIGLVFRPWPPLDRVQDDKSKQHGRRLPSRSLEYRPPPGVRG